MKEAAYGWRPVLEPLIQGRNVAKKEQLKFGSEKRQDVLHVEVMIIWNVLPQQVEEVGSKTSKWGNRAIDE